jgi:rod shape-determining protein MreD
MLALAGAFLLQVAIAPHLGIAGVVPNLLLLVAVTLALTKGPNAGCAAGFFAGLFLDLLGAGPIGLWALVLSVAGYLAGMLEANMFASGWLLPVTVVFVTSLAAEAAYGLVLGIVGAGEDFWASFTRAMLPGTVYNTVVAVLVYPWLARILRQEPTVRMVRRLL